MLRSKSQNRMTSRSKQNQNYEWKDVYGSYIHEHGQISVSRARALTHIEPGRTADTN